MNIASCTIGRAYCLDLDKVINIAEAHHYYFEQNEPRKRFQFFCPDAECRSKVTAEIAGVAYDKLSSERKVAFHFRDHNKHLPECSVAIDRAAREKIHRDRLEEASGLNVTRRFTKLTEVFDEFVIGNGETPSISAKQESTHTNSHRDLGRPRKIEYRKAELLGSPSRTFFLHDVVSCYLQMTEAERERAVIKIPNAGRLSYAKAFRRVPLIWDNLPRIYWGKIYAVIPYPNKGTFAVRFAVSIQLANETTRRKASLYITREQLESYRGRAVLQEELRSLATRKEVTVYGYFWGMIISSPSEWAADIKVDSLDHFVIDMDEEQN